MSIAFVFGLGMVVCWAALASLLWWFRPARPLWPVIFWSAISCLLWSMGEVGTSFVAVDRDSLWPWLLVLYTGVLFNAPLWWSFTLRFAEQHGARPAWASVSMERAPFALAVLCWLALVSNPWHGAFIEPVWQGRNGYRLFWFVQAAYGYACMLGAVGLLALARRGKRATGRARAQITILLLASLAPLLANGIYLSRIVDTPMDPTVLGFALGFALVVLGITRERLFSMNGLTIDHWLEHETDGVAIADLEGLLLRSNRAASELIGIEALGPGVDFVAQMALSLEEPDGAPLRRESLLQAELPREGWRLRRRDHPERRLRLTSTRVPGGWPTGDMVVLRLRDETELHRATERVARQASSIEAILASIRDGLLVVGESGRILYANERFWKIWRFGEADRGGVAESSLMEALAERVEDREALLALSAGTEGSGGSDAVELETRFGRVLAISAAPLLHGAESAGRVWSFRDVTDRRRVESEQRRIDERMRESQKLESLGVLAGGIAHDFNNILVGILGNVDLAARTLDPDSSAFRHFASVKRSADRAAELIHQLLAYAGRGQVEVQTFDLSGLVEETLQLLKSAVSKKAELDVRLAADMAIEGDPVQLRQIAMNLIINASDALGGRTGTIRIRTGIETLDVSTLEDALPRPPSPAPGVQRFACLEVADTGCGMDAATMGRIFEPFYTTKTEGRGLGLSAALGILKSHQGFIRVRSAPRRGTTFVLLLPLAQETSQRAAPPRAGAAPVGESPGTVLVVDDEEAVRSVAQSALEIGGFRVLLAKDGQEAVALFREHAGAIDVVVLDMTMPRMDGAEALFAMRQISRDTPVVLSSGYSEQDTMSRCSGLSGVSFVHKPYTAHGLLARVREAVASAPRRAPVAAPVGGPIGRAAGSE